MSPAQLQLALALVEQLAARQLDDYLAAQDKASRLFEERTQTMNLIDALRADVAALAAEAA